MSFGAGKAGSSSPFAAKPASSGGGMSFAAVPAAIGSMFGAKSGTGGIFSDKPAGGSPAAGFRIAKPAFSMKPASPKSPVVPPSPRKSPPAAAAAAGASEAPEVVQAAADGGPTDATESDCWDALDDNGGAFVETVERGNNRDYPANGAVLTMTYTKSARSA